MVATVNEFVKADARWNQSAASLDPTKANLDLWLSDIFTRVDKLEKTNTEFLKTIEEQKNEIKLLKENKTPATNPVNVWSSLFDTKKPDNTTRVMLNSVAKELDNKSKKENNIIISGLPEPSDSTPEEVQKHDIEKIDKLMASLSLNRSDIKKQHRIKRKNVTNNQLKPLELVLVEFNDKPSQEKALGNAKNLRTIDELKGVYVNPDKTENERMIDRQRRAERNKRNAALEFVSETEGRHRYGIIQSGANENRRYHWGIRSGELKQILDKTTCDQ